MANIAPSAPNIAQALIAPEYQAQQAQAQRNYALAQAMRQQSMEDSQAPGGGRVSWTQGVARLAQALSAGVLNSRADKQSKASNQAYAQGLRGMFQGGGGQASGAGGASAPPATLNVPEEMPAASQAPQPVQPSQQPSAPQQGQPDPLAAQPGPMAGGGSASAPPPSGNAGPGLLGNGSQRGAWSLTGNPNQDMSDYMLNPDKYGEAVIGQHSPNDTGKAVDQARARIDAGDIAGATAILQRVQKDNYTAPLNGRPGSTIRDPFNPSKIIGYDAPIQQGGVPQYDQNGQFTGYKAADGAVQIESAMAGAKAGAQAQAEAPYQMVEVTDAQGNKYQVPKSTLPGVGGNTQPSAGGGGSLNSYYGNQGHPASGAPTGNMSSISPQAQTAATTAGRNSANGFQEAIDAGAKAKDAGRSIDLIMTAANGLPTGTGSDVISELKSGVNAASGAFGGPNVFNADSIAKFDEMKKNASNLGAQLSSAAGQTGTDARLSNALSSLPGAHYSPQANQEVGLNLKALAAAASARANAAAVYQQQNGPGGYANFQGTWQNAYNPNLFYHMQKGDFQQWASKLSPAERAHTLGQYRSLKALGAFQ
jgi:hypothetical protein